MPGGAINVEGVQGKSEVKSPPKPVSKIQQEQVDYCASAIAPWVKAGDIQQLYNFYDPEGVVQFTDSGRLSEEQTTRRKNLKAALGIPVDADLSSLELADIVSKYKKDLAAALSGANSSRSFMQGLAETYLTQLLSEEKIKCLLSESPSKDEIKKATTNLDDSSVNPLIRFAIALVIHKNISKGAAILKPYLMSCSPDSVDYTEFASTYLRKYLDGNFLAFLEGTLGIPGIPNKDRREIAYNKVLNTKRFHINAEATEFKRLSQIPVSSGFVSLASSLSSVDSVSAIEIDLPTVSSEKREAVNDEEDAVAIKKAKLDQEWGVPKPVAYAVEVCDPVVEEVQIMGQHPANTWKEVSSELYDKLSAFRERAVQELGSQQERIADLEQQLRRAVNDNKKLSRELAQTKADFDEHRKFGQGVVGQQRASNGSPGLPLPLGFGFFPAVPMQQSMLLSSPPVVQQPVLLPSPPGFLELPSFWSSGMYVSGMPQQPSFEDPHLLSVQGFQGPHHG